MTQEEADRKKNRARLQELASIGIAAMGIKSVMDDWKDVHGTHEDYKDQRHAQERRREKKSEKERSRSRHGDRRHSDTDLRLR